MTPVAPLGDGHRERGMVTAIVVVFVAGLLVLSGLVVDGGAVLAARARAVDQAQAAARAGAQHIDLAAYRADGTLALDTEAAATAAHDYIAATGNTAEVTVTAQEITVALSIDQPLVVLDAGAGATITLTGRGAARPTPGTGP